MAKRKKDTMSSVALTSITSTVAIGSIPSNLAPGVSGIKENAAKGFAKAGSTLPTVGKLKGTEMVLKQLKKIKKKKGVM